MIMQTGPLASLVVLLAIGISSCHDGHLQAKKVSRIDTTIIRVYDYTGDGVIDTSSLHVIGDDFDSPFSWTYDLRSKGQAIIHREGSDLGWDSLFYEKGFEDYSSDYITGKQKFFFHELGLYVLQSKDYSGSDLVASMVDPGISITYPFLRDSCGLDDRDARALIDSVANKIMSHTAVLTTFNETPVSNEAVMIYVAKLNRFIPVCED